MLHPCLTAAGRVPLVKVSLVMALSVGGAAQAAGAEVDFAHEVVPILREHCVECHGGGEAKGGFSLNSRELLRGSGHVAVGVPDASYLLELIASDDPDQQMPPPGQPRVPEEAQRILHRWIAQGMRWDEGVSIAAAVYDPPLQPRRPELPPAEPGRDHPVDRLVDAYWRNNAVETPAEIDDATFLRRVTLDLVGLLPEPQTLQDFLADDAADKRSRMIERLLADEIAYADHWMSFFNDLLRNDYSGTGFITGGRAQISGWLYEALRSNRPFNVMVHELIAPPTAASRGYIDGIRWRGEVSAGQTVEIQFAQSIAQSFLGINLKCASCHDSFVDRWTLEDAYGLAAIYAETPLAIHRCDLPVGRQAQPRWLFPELGDVDATASREQRLAQLADLMTHRDNGRFTRTIVNRLWYQLMGRGIVHPLDAMQNEPWDADLLDTLAVYLADHQYDLKAVLRLIATSRAYQSATAVQVEEASLEPTYRGPVARRMTAEQFLDSVWQITGAAPAKIDAPVFRGVADQDADVAGDRGLQAQWIWGDSAAEGAMPAGGESITLRKTFSLPSAVRRGGAVITCDNQFALSVNGRELIRGDDWTQPQTVALHTLLRKGDNDFVVAATNGGSAPNPAGLLLEARLMLEDGQEIVIASDDTWQFHPHLPSGREGRLGAIAGPWSPVTVVPPVAAWSRAVDAAAQASLAIDGGLPMARAGLLKNNFLMKALGRPSREQIVSMRPSELSTLEAIHLSNGEVFAEALARGASDLAERPWANREQLIGHVFRFALSRPPHAAEAQAILDFLSPEPTPEEIEDLLWSIFMMPEFLLIR